jgi:hypothetical protein
MAKNVPDLSERIRRVFRAAALYRGTRRGDQDFAAPLAEIEAEIWTEAGGKPTPEFESGIIRQALNGEGRDVQSLLDILQRGIDARDRALNALFNGATQDTGIEGLLVVHHPQVFVPTDPRALMTGSGDGTITPPRYEPRLARLLSFLSDQGVKMDDLVIYQGLIDERSMREHPYFIVDILERNVQVAVCNQTGNATFVSQTRMIPAEWGSYTKPELEALPHIRRVEDRSTQKWLEAIWDHIVTANAPRMDVNAIKAEQKRIQRLRGPDLSADIIWRDALYHLKQTGEWVGATSGPVLNRPGDDWKNVDAACFNGTRGLAAIQGTSVPQIIHSRVRQVMEACKSKHGEYPTRDTPGPFGDDPDISWATVEDALLKKYGSKTSLYMLIHGNDLSEEMIWRDALYHLKQKSKWAGLASGPVLNRPGDNWASVQSACQMGLRGLAAIKGITVPQIIHARIRQVMEAYKILHEEYPTRDTPGPFEGDPDITWAMVEDALLNNHGAKTSLYMLIHGNDLSEEMIWRDALYHLKQTGEWAKQHSGPVLNRPGDDWINVCAACSKGHRGLAAIKGTTVTQLVQKHVAEKCREYHARTGTWPWAESRTDMFDAEFGITCDTALRACLFQQPPNVKSAYTRLFQELDPGFIDPYKSGKRLQPGPPTP